MPELLTEEGVFTDEFIQNLPETLGEGYESDGKLYENLPKKPEDLFKGFIDNKRNLSKRLDGVIQKPAEDADNVTKEEFHKTLRTELGILPPEKKEDYEFHRPEKMPDGVHYSERAETALREWAFKHKIPKEVLKEGSQILFESQMADMAEIAASANDEAAKDTTLQRDQLRADWAGDKLKVNSRIAILAMNKFNFISDDVKEAIKREKLYDKPEDFDAWDRAGITIDTRRQFCEIGMGTLSAEVIQGETAQPAGFAEDDQSHAARLWRAKRDYPNSPELWPKS